MGNTKILTSAYITLSKVFDGADGFTISLSNPTMNILCDNDGIPFPGELGPDGKATCTVKVFGTRQLNVTSSPYPGPGQYSISIDYSQTINCEPIIKTSDTIYINSIGTDSTAKAVITVDIEGKNKVKQEINIMKSLASDVPFGVDGKFIYGKNMWSANKHNYQPLDSNVKVVKSNEAKFGTNILEIVGEHWLYSAKKVKFDPRKIYRLTFRGKQSMDPFSGSKQVYIGIAPFDEHNNEVGYDGAGNRYFSIFSLSNSWETKEIYFAKDARSAIQDTSGTIKYPSVNSIPANTDYFYTVCIVNYGNQNGIVELDGFTLEDATAEFEVAEVKNKTVKLESDMQGINASVSTIKTITDKSNNPMVLKCKVNYSSYSNRDPGELYLHGLNENKSPGDVDGICRWLDYDIRLPRTKIDPEKQVPPNTPAYIAFDRGLSQWMVVWNEISDTNESNWRCFSNVDNPYNRNPYHYNPNEANHIFVGYFVVSEKKDKGTGDDIIAVAQLFTGALSYSQATSMSLSSSLSQIEIIEDNINMKVDKDGVVAAINIYTQVDDSGTNTSGVKIKGDKIDLEGQVTFSSLSDNPEEGLRKLFNKKSNTTTINGGYIETKSILADSIDLLSGITVLGQDNMPVFAVSKVSDDRGTVEVNGLLKSGNFSETLNTGYKISPDGTAILNQAKIRGDVILPNAGMTNYGANIGNFNLIRNSDNLSATTWSKEKNIKVEKATNKNSWNIIKDSTTSEPVGVYTDVDVKGETEYTFSFNCGSFENGTYSVGTNITSLTKQNASNRFAYYIKYKQALSNNLNTATFKTAKGENKIRIYFSMPKDKKGLLEIYNTKLEEGSNVTPWAVGLSEQNRNYTRIWAGTSFESRDTAPFRVMQNGDVYARNGTYEGILRGTLDSGDVQVFNNAITVNSPNTETEIIGIRAQQTYFKTDFALGDNTFVFSKSQKTFAFNEAVVSFKHIQNYDSGASLEFSSKGDAYTSFKIVNPIINSNTSFNIGYNSDDTNRVILSHTGNKGTNSDIEFRRKDTSQNIDVFIRGNIGIKNAIRGENNSIEIRNMGAEGWGFFAH